MRRSSLKHGTTTETKATRRSARRSGARDACVERVVGDGEVAEARRLGEARGEGRRIGRRPREELRRRIEVAPELLGGPARRLAGRSAEDLEREGHLEPDRVVGPGVAVPVGGGPEGLRAREAEGALEAPSGEEGVVGDARAQEGERVEVERLVADRLLAQGRAALDATAQEAQRHAWSPARRDGRRDRVPHGTVAVQGEAPG